MRRILVAAAGAAAITMAVFMPAAQAQFQPEKLSPIGEKIEAAMKSDIRTAEEKGRDEERKPRQTLEFFGLKDDMRVIELVPSGGWYTKILGQVLADKGELYVAIGTRQVAALVKDVPALAKVKIAPDVKMTPVPGNMGLFTLNEFSLGVTDADLVLTFRNLHNFTLASRPFLHKAVFNALKPGGLLRRARPHAASQRTRQPGKRAARGPGAGDQGDPGRRLRAGRLLQPALQAGRRAALRGRSQDGDR